MMDNSKRQEWKECKLGDLGNVITGKTPSRDNPEDFGEVMPFVTPTDYKNFTKYIYQANRFLSPTGIGRLQNKVLPEKSIMITCIGSDMGKVALNKQSVITNQQINSIIPNPKVADSDYLFYLLTDMYETLRSYGLDGTAVPILNKSTFEGLLIALPPLPEQRAIAGVLSSLDDKIDLLHRENKTLEGMAAAVWRKMFVEEADPGWRKGKLGDIADINPLRSIRHGTVATYLDMSNMPTDGPFPKDWVQREFSSGMKFKNGDTIIARITPCLENGKTAYVNFLVDEEIGWGSTEYVVLSPKPGYCSEWFYFLGRNEGFRDYAIQNMTGTSGRQRVSGESLAEYEMPIPTEAFFEGFQEIASPVMKHIRQNSFQIRTLSRLRDTLLPKLMSGEVRV